MAVTINGKPFKPAKTPKKKKSGHTQPKPYHGSLNEPGRFRVANWLHLLNIAHSTFYVRLNYKYHKYPVPQPDGHDPNPYWHTATVLKYNQE